MQLETDPCKHFSDGQCAIASHLASLLPCYVTNKTCEACQKTNSPRSENKVTAGVAAVAMIRSKVALSKEVQDLLHVNVDRPLVDAPAYGPGSELARIISWFYSEGNGCPVCKYRMQKMNIWGPDECEQRIDQIVVWLKQAGKKRGIPFIEIAAKAIVNRAINAARKNDGKHAKAV